MQAIDTSELSRTVDGAAPASDARMTSPALVIDFDRALIRAEPLYERLLAALKARPLAVPGLAAAALRGRAALDEAAARDAGAEFRIAACPRRPAVERIAAEAARRATP